MFISILFLLTTAHAAVPLDDLLKKQEVVEIFPVEHNGVRFASGYEDNEGRSPGARICKAAGFTRLISSEAEKCVGEEKLCYFHMDDISEAPSLRCHGKCGMYEGMLFRFRMKKVVCAK